MRHRTFTVSIRTRWLIAGLAVLLIGGLIPTALAVGGTFTDDDSSIFEQDIEWLARAAVTKGCNPSEGNTHFCPEDEVTRGQMAAFMRRFARFLGAEDGVVDAADTAGDAAKLDGLSASAFVRHGPLVIGQHGSAWGPLGEGWSDGDFVHRWDSTEVDGSGRVMIPLTSPQSLAGVAYRLISVEFCYRMGNDIYGDNEILAAEVYAGSLLVRERMIPVLSSTERACHVTTVGDAALGGAVLVLDLFEPGLGTDPTVLYSVTATWEPST